MLLGANEWGRIGVDVVCSWAANVLLPMVVPRALRPRYHRHQFCDNGVSTGVMGSRSVPGAALGTVGFAGATGSIRW